MSTLLISLNIALLLVNAGLLVFTLYLVRYIALRTQGNTTDPFVPPRWLSTWVRKRQFRPIKHKPVNGPIDAHGRMIVATPKFKTPAINAPTNALPPMTTGTGIPMTAEELDVLAKEYQLDHEPIPQ